ncbi:hypothetical protein [Brevundimonas sp.]|uniref:hypothetical protein n=1 Tax=Brevundimonas sp. TaxID=1871086 RepID=UPI003A932819
MSTKRIKIHYRRLIRTPDSATFPAASLSECVASAMDAQLPNGTLTKERARNRVAPVVGSPGYERMLNTYFAGDGFVFGTVCLFSPGQLQALLRVADDEAEQPDLAEVLEQLEIAETAAPKGHEYVHGMTYWLATGDHFYQIQHVSLQSKAMEEYLTWLLRDKTGVLSATQAVMLQWKFDRAQVGVILPRFSGHPC